MNARRFITPRFIGLLAAAVVVLQFAAVQHSATHGGAMPDVGCEFCVSGAGHAPPPSLAPTAHVGGATGHGSETEHADAIPKPRRTTQPARAPPSLT